MPITLFVALTGIYYIRSRENMAMIERGMNPRNSELKLRPFSSLKIALLSIGVGVGAVVAMLLLSVLPARTYMYDGRQYTDDLEELYPALMAIFGGIGLLISYLIERREYDRRKPGMAEGIKKEGE